MPLSTRTVLLDSALRLLDAGGADAVTLREVGKGAGVSHNAPYKHFANKEALLAAVAARELSERVAEFARVVQDRPDPLEMLRAVLHGYISWALEYPARFHLVFGRWTEETPELAETGANAQAALIALVAQAQAAGSLPAADPERLASLVRATAHGAVGFAATGHLSADGKGHADPTDLVDDLLTYLTRAR
ncbi:TetR/AcrR family transcriptional regulator [Nocardia sp. CDC160]|uniref:TetR/AcrR family transcriptional regulator n=1 Tax=Nocardia sp. CDC160 TaxID=3112166 RepID=UPI002DB7CCA9|nr:TetR/AcrR family transcriptional regulator [Nocardia sp. CDC160]MEC3914393.1 TetR/AcrR family transcriptional regulator [Nocardia sp. CDC160]